MVKLGMLAVDGTRLQANANRHRFRTREQLEQEQARLDELIKGLLQKAEAADQAHQGEEEPAELPPELANEQKRRRPSRRPWNASSNEKLSKKSKKNNWLGVVGKQQRQPGPDESHRSRLWDLAP